LNRPSKICVKEPVLVNTLREQAKDKEEFDKSLELTFNLYTPHPEIDYPDGRNG
jgi:hypothetical protein